MSAVPATPAVTGPTLRSSTGAGHTRNTTAKGRRSTAAGQPIRGIQPVRVTRPPRPMGTACSPCSLGRTWWRLSNKDGNTAVVNRKCVLCPLLHCTTPVTTVTRTAKLKHGLLKPRGSTHHTPTTCPIPALPSTR